jgi:cholesterol transport system auxiliary component
VKALPTRAMMTALCAASICLAMPGCAFLSPSKVDIEKSVLNELPTDVPRRATAAGTVLVFPPATMPAYDTVLMAYRTEPREIAYFNQRQWGATPSQMIEPLLVATLEKTHSFHIVLLSPYTGPYEYSLRTQILDLIQDFTPKSATLVLSLRFQLAGYGASGVIATRDISVREPMLQMNSGSGVVAANAAIAKALQRMAQFVLESTAANAAAKDKP